MSDAKTIAVIPARGGSKGVPRKNLRCVGGIPLVGRTVQAARAAPTIDGVYVSTDDAEIAAVAADYGAAVIERPAALATDEASSEVALLHALDWLEARGERVDVLAFLQCTSPFTTPDDIDRVVHAVTRDGFDSAFSATPTHRFLWRRSPTGDAEGVNHDPRGPRERRQERRLEFLETGAVYAMNVRGFRVAGTRFCGRVGLASSELDAFEVDSVEDILLAETIALHKSPRQNDA